MFSKGALLDAMSALSVSVAVLVIVCMTAAFSILLIAYGSNKRKLINAGGEDESIRAEIEKGYDKFRKSDKGDKSVRSYLAAKEKKERVLSVVSNLIFGVVIAAVLALAAAGLVYKFSGGRLFLGNTTYLTVQTGSMSGKNPSNDYYSKLPDNQIPQYALIGIDKVEEEDLKLYDIVAFEQGGVTYVHRIVEITENANGKLYTTMGDNNAGAMPAEIGMGFDKIVGRYNGYQSAFLGTFISYLQSDIGLIAIFFAFILVLVADIADGAASKIYKKRYAYLAQSLDGASEEEKPAPEEIAEVTAEPESRDTEETPRTVAENPAPAEEIRAPENIAAADNTDGAGGDGELVLRDRKGFLARLILGGEEDRAAYNALKNEILSYGGVKARVGWKGENFKYNKKLILALKIRGKTLCVYLPLDPEKYAEGKIRVDAAGDVDSGLPSLYKINGKRKTGYAKRLIAEVMAANGARQGEVKNTDWLAEYTGLSREELIERGLIRELKDTAFSSLKARGDGEKESEGL